MDTSTQPPDFHETRGVPAGNGQRYPCVLIDVQAHPEVPQTLNADASFNFLPRMGDRVEVASDTGHNFWLVVGIVHSSSPTAGCDIFCADPISPVEYVMRLCRAYSNRPRPVSRRRRT
jgi:hypothetical protein